MEPSSPTEMREASLPPGSVIGRPSRPRTRTVGSAVAGQILAAVLLDHQKRLAGDGDVERSVSAVESAGLRVEAGREQDAAARCAGEVVRGVGLGGAFGVQRHQPAEAGRLGVGEVVGNHVLRRASLGHAGGGKVGAVDHRELQAKCPHSAYRSFAAAASNNFFPTFSLGGVQPVDKRLDSLASHRDDAHRQPVARHVGLDEPARYDAEVEQPGEDD